MYSWRTALLASLLSGSTLEQSAGGDSALHEVGTAQVIEVLAEEMAEDPRSLALGLELRTAHLQAIAHPTAHDLIVATETMELLAPLADHAGMSSKRARLEDASFRLLDPERFEAMASHSAAAGLLENTLTATRAMLQAQGIDGVVTGRTKSLYSAHQKLSRKGLAPAELLDRTGLRVRVDTALQCYNVIDRLHQLYEPIEGSYDDYIAQPKPSGYRSLHTAVLVHGAPVEFQVRTNAMHQQAEHGPASHWRYKLEA